SIQTCRRDLVLRRGHSSARPGDDRRPRPGLPARGSPLRDAAHDPARDPGDRARLLLRVHAEGGGRPARKLDQGSPEDLCLMATVDDQFYREYILDHYKNPRNYGRLEHPDISHEEDNPPCG